MRQVILGCVLLSVAACGGSNNSPTSPSNPNPTPTSVALTGNVSLSTGQKISGTTVRISDGPNAGRSVTTNGNGDYRIDNLTPANANVFAGVGSQCFQETGKGVYINGVNTLNFVLERGPIWSVSGTGDTVFDMPRCVSRVHIVATYTGYSSNFIVHVDGSGLVNELLGTGWRMTRYEGTLLTTGGVTEIVHSSGVRWTFTEVR